MAEPLKSFFSRSLVRQMAADVARVDPAFRKRAFTGSATKGLEELELLSRGRHTSKALAEHLSADYPNAISVPGGRGCQARGDDQEAAGVDL